MSHNQSWNHGWAGHSGGWAHDNWGWHHYGPGWSPWWGVGFWWPGWSFGWGPGYYGYGYYGFDYGVDYYVAPYGLTNSTYEVVPYTSNYAPSETETAAMADAPPQTGGETSDFFSQATEAFHQGEYQAATRLAAHASIDDPRNPSVHLLMSLGLFAMKEYRGAAMESHAVAALGKAPDWPVLFGFYGDVKPYTEQLRALEKYVRENPSSPEGRFLLGFHYMMGGHQDTAKDEFLKALKLTPKDRLAAQLLTQLGGTVPADIAAQLPQQPSPKAPTPPPAPEVDKSVPLLQPQ
jgi:tetratricopeptide (TPR) repeat protein